MRKLGILPLLLILTTPAWADATPEDALKAYVSSHGPYPLSHERLSSEGRLVLQADSSFVQTLVERPAWIRSACESWTAAIRASRSQADPSLVILIPKAGGSLWECGDSQPVEIESWDDTKPIFTGTTNQVGVPYISIAGQASFGQAVNTYGFNLAEGITLANRKTDLALTVGLVGSSAGLTMSLGLLFRYRIPLVPAFGINFGINPAFLMTVPSVPDGDTTSPTLQTALSCGFLGGFNFNVPTGTIDVTGSIATNGAYTALLGHTFFFNVR